MSNNSSKRSNKLERIANIFIILVSLLLLVVLAKRHFIPSSATHDNRNVLSNRIHVGSRFSLPDIDWNQNGETLVVVMSEGCSHCAESIPFYRRLSRELSVRESPHFLALFPDSSGDAQKYLNDMNIRADAVVSTSLGELGINLLPSIYLVDKEGSVTDNWLGRLTAAGESNLLERLNIKAEPFDTYTDAENSNDPVPNITAYDLKVEIEKLKQVIILDVDDREKFATGHIPGAKNIPLDELEARASNEIPTSYRVVAYCRCKSNDTLSKQAYHFLRKKGILNVAVLHEGLHAWKQAALPIIDK